MEYTVSVTYFVQSAGVVDELVVVDGAGFGV